MDQKIKFNLLAFSKMVMHTMKYPHSICCGLLLSTDQKGDDDEKELVDCVPITHSSHHLAPAIEVATNSVNTYAKDKNLSVAGYYYTDRPNEAFVQWVNEIYPDAISCAVSFDEKGTPQVDTRRRKTAIECNIEHYDSIKKILYTKEKLYREVVDFDDFFDDISLDWTNPKVYNLLAQKGLATEAVK